MPRLHVPGPERCSFLSSLSGSKLALQGRLLAGTHRDNVPSSFFFAEWNTHGGARKMERTRDIRLYTGVDWIGRSAKRATGTKQRDSLGISIGERVGAVGPSRGIRGILDRGRRVQNQSRGSWKKDLDLAAVRVLDGCCGPNQPPTAKNLIRCHNYTQWRSTSIERPTFDPRRRASVLQTPLFLLMGFMLTNVDWAGEEDLLATF